MKTILTLKSIEDFFVETELKNWYYEIGTCAFKEIDGGGKMMLVSCDSEGTDLVDKQISGLWG